MVLLFRFGGLYLDSDVITTKPLIMPDQKKYGDSFVIAQNDWEINNAILKFSVGHPFVNYQLERMVRITIIIRTTIKQ